MPLKFWRLAGAAAFGVNRHVTPAILPVVEPYNITCTTCEARLKVSDPELIGRILACPRCESMVQVTPPLEGMSTASESGVLLSQPEVPASAGTVEAPVSAGPPALKPPPLPPAGAAPASPLDSISPTEQWWRTRLMLLAVGGISLFAVGGMVVVALDRSESPGGPAKTASADVTMPATASPAAEPIATDPEPIATDDQDQIIPTDGAAIDPSSETAEATVVADPPEEGPKVQTDDDVTDVSIVADEPAISDERPDDPTPPSKTATPPSGAMASGAMRIHRPANDAGPRRDVQEALAEKLPSANFPAIPLRSFCDVLFELTGLSITLDLPALHAAGVDKDKSVSVQMSGAPIAELLTDGLGSVGLTYKIDGAGILVTTPSAASEQLRRYRYPAADLVTSDLPLESLVELLKRFVRPRSWQDQGGRGHAEIVGDQLWIEQTPTVHYELVSFCERLRIVRGLPLQSRYPAERFRRTTQSQAAAALLARRGTWTFHEPTRLIDVVRFIGETCQVPLCADWRSLAAINLYPETKVTCSIDDQPLGDALQAMLEPVGLAWRPLDGPSLQILSQAAANEALVCEFYPLAGRLPPGGSPERLVAEVRGAKTDRHGRGQIAYDASSRSLIVLNHAGGQREVAAAMDRLTNGANEPAP